MPKNFERLSISLDAELVKDINFVMMKQSDITEPKNSYGKFFYDLLRPIIPHRNTQDDVNVKKV